MDHDPGVLVRVTSALCSDDVRLTFQRPSSVDHAILEDNSRVSKDEVDSSVDVAFAIELTLGVDKERVLVSLEPTSEEDSEVGGRSKRNRLSLQRPRRVAKRDAASDEAKAVDS